MIAPADAEALARALGEPAVRSHEAADLDGAKIGVTLAPADAHGVGAALRLLGERGLAAVVRGGGSKLHLGNPPRRADVWLSTGRLSGVLQLDADDGVVEVRAGTPLGSLRQAVREAGWDVGLEAGDPAATVGGVLAAAEHGLRATCFGRPRDAVLGLGVVLGSGERARCGGRVVKNVTGYDLAKLYVGSLGTLCVIESAWLRLRPLPRAVRVLAAPAQDEAQATLAARAVARLASARAVALVDESVLAGAGPAGARAAPGALVLVAELAGEEAVVEAESARARELAALAPADAALLDRILARRSERPAEGRGPRAHAQPNERPGDAPPEAAGDASLRFRISFRPSRAAPVLVALRHAGAERIAQPHAAEVVARFRLARAGEPELSAVLRAVRESAREGEGHALLEAAPAWVKHGRDVFGAPGDAIALARAVKARFDPRGVLSPGRFVGGI